MLSKEEILQLARLYNIEVDEDDKGHKIRDLNNVEYIGSQEISSMIFNNDYLNDIWISVDEKIRVSSEIEYKYNYFNCDNKSINIFNYGGEVA